ncbi:DUF4097 and DUF4098 domain-containing protein YvlB [Virgibacillus natechei]|uniref:DUF4097 and DUF4098 domain-containing protein YvlB n=1 Tax=Virgibacillus natechei TaxID=1216297 RepID=A0ABS4IDN4_9BACI|nr:CotO family spore coat protein [Virgibacillus natechei]MBP1969055.1 DUF4097 and DUF4098 domain-containing protein YvlB [Virgibacillus natechei]UZD14325.1 spore coat CotO family protein [Virgibacillus natechei]
MAKKKFAKDPLLYISQPTTNATEAPMQYNYTSPKKRRNHIADQRTSEQAAQPTHRRPLKRNFFKQELNQVEEAESESEESNDEEVNKEDEQQEREVEERETRKFKDMTLKEKVYYFMNQSDYTPKMRCEIKTKERTYRGTINDFQDEEVHMRVGKRASNTKIAMEEITSIRMLGF